MNTANLQLQGLLLATYALLDFMKQKGVLKREEIEQRQYGRYDSGKLFDHRSTGRRN